MYLLTIKANIFGISNAIALTLEIASILTLSAYSSVMIATPSDFTAQEFLAFEQESTAKHDYRNGKVYAMAGASNKHVIIASNLFASLRYSLRGTGCRPYMSESKVHISSNNTYYYPDVVVSRDSRESGLQTFLSYPCLVVEVLSDTTEAFDRGDKFSDYHQLDSIQEYILVNKKRMAVEVFHRHTSVQRISSTYCLATDIIQFHRVNARIEIAELYEDVDFDSEST